MTPSKHSEQIHLFDSNEPATHDPTTTKTVDVEETEGPTDIMQDIGYRRPATFAEALAIIGLSKVTPEPVATPSIETRSDEFNFSIYETDRIGFGVHTLENGRSYIFTYDKTTGDKDIARVLDTSYIVDQTITADQCKRMVRNSEILLSQYQNAA